MQADVYRSGVLSVRKTKGFLRVHEIGQRLSAAYRELKRADSRAAYLSSTSRLRSGAGSARPDS